MLRLITVRAAYYAVLIFLSTSAAYLLSSVAMSPRSNYEGRTPPPPPEAVERTLYSLGVNDHDPLILRYLGWLGRAVTGDFGQTLVGTSANAEFAARIGSSVRLLVIGSVIGALGGIALGVWNALRQYRLSDRVSTALSFLIMSMPVFTIAVLLKMGATSLNRATGIQLINFTGSATPGLTGGFWTQLLDAGVHMLLPTIAIVLGGVAGYSRYQRSTMLDTLGSDYLRTARAKGLTRGRATTRHALRMAVIPMTTMFSYGMIGVVTGATMTEQIYGWNGLGKWFIDSVNRQDINAVTLYCAFAALVVLISGLCADLLHGALDPRARV